MVKVVLKDTGGERTKYGYHWIGEVNILTWRGQEEMVLTGLLVYKEYAGQKYGNKLLRIAKKFAEKEGRPVYLWAGPFDHASLPYDKLVAWYIKHGFVPKYPDEPGKRMTYTPRSYKKCKTPSWNNTERQ
jgi:GNAT superfamily N-acetyltransferase